MLNLASAVSLLLLAATSVVWPVSYTSRWSADFGAPLHNGSTERSTDWAWHLRSADGTIHLAPVNSLYGWDTPYWKLALLFAVAPGWQAARWLRRRRGPQLERTMPSQRATSPGVPGCTADASESD